MLYNIVQRELSFFFILTLSSVEATLNTKVGCSLAFTFKLSSCSCISLTSLEDSKIVLHSSGKFNNF
ncbi:MAG: hypothetical protein EP298_00220 [Gammaproteobacteria bacterium]|nr:MAG: hypothetical protein EP298_00220 [Gammaproteobacteria bacterium]